jgi:hypothetical protein
MLVTLNEMKDYLGIPLATTTYDGFLTEQITVISDAIEKYCGRKFASATYTQTIYKDQFENRDDKTVYLLHYPLQTVNSIQLDTITVTGYRIEYDYGRLTKIDGFVNGGEELIINYTAGYSTIPSPIKQTVYSLVEEKYNKKKAGIPVNFGNDVQSIAIAGTISISYDYSLQANDRKGAFGMILGNYLNVIDMYRSERRLLGKIEETKYA